MSVRLPSSGRVGRCVCVQVPVSCSVKNLTLKKSYLDAIFLCATFQQHTRTQSHLIITSRQSSVYELSGHCSLVSVLEPRVNIHVDVSIVLPLSCFLSFGKLSTAFLLRGEAYVCSFLSAMAVSREWGGGSFIEKKSRERGTFLHDLD